jgi:hypothetical protein
MEVNTHTKIFSALDPITQIRQVKNLIEESVDAHPKTIARPMLSFEYGTLNFNELSRRTM